ncbi:MAG: ribonuclease III [Candidatus Brennerbacteria bacterium]|nr:ribonuclease III [Candidatus Brennerbacteria bacterium]
MAAIKELQETIGVKFKKPELLQEALTHRSYLNENPRWPYPHNERMEFLGDAVLELAVTEFLYAEYPKEPEGWLTSLRAALVNYQMLAKIAREINLEKSILLSRGEAKDNGKAREVILANAFEALIGAVYLDQGYKISAGFIKQFVLIHLETVLEQGLYKDPKSKLQEVVQEKLKITPVYRVLEEKGPDHQKIFKIGVYFGDKLIAEGAGASKQEAEVEAAKSALSGWN